MRSARRRASGRSALAEDGPRRSPQHFQALNGTCSNFRQTMVFFLLDRLRSIPVGPSRFESEKPLLIHATRTSTAAPRKRGMVGQEETQCVVFPPFVVGCSHL